MNVVSTGTLYRAKAGQKTVITPRTSQISIETHVFERQLLILLDIIEDIGRDLNRKVLNMIDSVNDIEFCPYSVAELFKLDRQPPAALEFVH
jgi:hypothetical protein